MESLSEREGLTTVAGVDGGVGKLWSRVFRVGMLREEKAFIGKSGDYKPE